MIHRHLRLAAAVAAGLLSGAFSLEVTAAEPGFSSPYGFELDAPGAMRASQAYVQLHQATANYLAADRAGAALSKRKAAQDTAMASLKTYEASLAAADRDIAALVAALKQSNRLSSLDKDFYAHPHVYLSTPGEVAAVRAAGGPVAVLSNSASYCKQDVAEFRSQLGLGKTTWRFDLNPIPKAHAGTACSMAAWSLKMLCLGTKSCYNFWTKTNYDNCM